MAKKQYSEESISSLKGADRVRRRPAVIFGSDGIEGCQHSIFEILSNSIDEAREGHGNKITITKYLDMSVEIEDNGRGIPVGFNQKEQKYNWELLFCEMYAGGKYNNITGDSYEYSLGLNGLGLCATQYASLYMDATICYDHTKYELHFEKGENVGGLKTTPIEKNITGTKIRWKADLDVFTDTNVSVDYFREILKKQAIVNAGLKFILKIENEKHTFDTEEFLYENGVVDYIEEVANLTALTEIMDFRCERSGKDRADMAEYKLKMQIAFCFSNQVQLLEYYHNSSFLEHGGSPEKAVKSAFVTEIDRYLKENNKYTKNESKITFLDVTDCLILVTNSFSTQTSYENQTKKSITNKFIAESMTAFLKHQIEIYFKEKKADADKIADMVLINKRSRENAEKARVDIKKKLTTSLDITNRIAKFVDCRSKDLSIRELYIVEGDSALGSCKLGRDSSFQAIMPVRGKILNCLKAGYDKILKSEIITNLIKILGCGVEIKTKDFNAFDLNSLRWNKVIICTDADVDGFQIRTLILTMLYKLTPTLIREGRVYIAESPLFEITSGSKVFFAYTEKEKQEIVEKIGDKKYNIQRSKGLGENEPEMMWQTTMNPKTRRLIRVVTDDAVATANMFDILLGDNLEGRKKYITENGAKYLELADIE
ncbi:MAG: toprim domain-containing protein [Clostridia bacterium]